MKLGQWRQRSWVAAAFALTLALSLLLSQALWLVHRVAHSGLIPQRSANSVAAVSGVDINVHADAEAKVLGSWTQALLPQHNDERSCAQFDHLTHADMAPGCGEPPGLSQAHCLALSATHVASQLAAQAAGFLARGPPATV